ncbi:HSA domain-containing protein/Myb_DNA-bind_6 domain-containing protein [Cephalotus follicularis]|uniref:HSA domain-containing protein/Myb_DNA-bind_6 domain-containing protein n=1 Tax=Cephalotus follicularis TaxID=3775 RepID=A0A1Q3BS11_CEPFO|nr:HSA domain-containing protein/Myb_DNA-bind_6 domain-containing protein [Cephalotus follicularis]
MHGCGSGSALLVNAEVDSMGGVVDGGVGIGVKTSPRRAAIERAQAELRQEYDVREERRRELEFLEKGGNPLDFKFGNAASVSVQSTSLTDQQPEHFGSEAKGSFAVSPRGDSLESSGRPRVPTVSEPNTADNLLLFDGENELHEGKTNSSRLSKRNSVAPSEQSSHLDGTQNAKESEDSAIFLPYVRRNRSRINRDGARSSSTDIAQSRGGHGSLPTRGLSRDAKGSLSETNNKKEQNLTSVSNTKSATSNGDIVSKLTADKQLDMVLDGAQAMEVTTGLTKDSLPEAKEDVTSLPEVRLDTKSLMDDQHNQPSHVNTQQTPNNVSSGQPVLAEGKEQVDSAGFEYRPSGITVKVENETGSGQLNGFVDTKIDRQNLLTERQNSSAAIGMKGLDSESSCTRNSLTLDANNESDVCINPRDIDSNGVGMGQASELEGTPNLAGGELVNENNKIKAVDSVDNKSVYQNHSGISSVVKVEEEAHGSVSDSQNEVKYPSNVNVVEQNDHMGSEIGGNVDTLDFDSPPNGEAIITGKPQGSMDIFMSEPKMTISGRNSVAAPDLQTGSDNGLKLAAKAHEDSVLEEARIIEAKRKRIAELSVHTLSLENRHKSHWDFVLEEMAWLANDFAQERLWKMTAAAQICRRVAFTSRLTLDERGQCWKLKKVAYTLAKAVMQFWHSAEMLLNSDDSIVGVKNCRHDLVESRRVDGNELLEGKIDARNKVQEREMELEYPGKNLALAVQEYAVRFLKYSNSPVPPLQAEAPSTPDRISDSGATEILWDEHLTEESLFYAVPSGAMESYRKSIESHSMQCEKTASSIHEEVETSVYDAAGEFGCHENTYDEDEGETSLYYLPGAFEGTKSSKSSQKKRKNLMKSYTPRSYELGADLPYGQCTNGSQQSVLIGKRPANSLNVGSIPTKRVRTAYRQRVVSPFNAGAAGGVQAPVKTDASSGDTNSFQDDQSTLHGGSQIQKSVEVESVGDFEKQSQYDFAETSAKPKKKKKPKHLGTSYEQGWQPDSTFHHDQRDHSRKRLDNHQFDSNGTTGLYLQHNTKKPKIMKQSLDNTFDNMTATGSIPSPVASQMSNMSNPNKLIKLIGGRDRGRKVKGLKMAAVQPGCGSPWSLFEDQALVVLVHDMGPNWELVSDAINSTLQFKCIFRKPTECKERHKNLMDKSGGDGADSAEDSGSSQSYPSTLPGIPKGSARQLFQRLQGPMEEDTIKSHFEKIITIGKKQHHRRSLNENQDTKQIVTVHNSHVIALSQACPNNPNGGVLTPLDLCDAASSPDVISLGYQGSHASGLAMSNQGSVASILPSSGSNSSLTGSTGMVIGGNLPPPSVPLSTSVRDSRYNVPRTSLPVDDQQRMQQYNQMISNRNIQQSNLSVPGALSGADRGVRMLPGGNGVGMMCGMNRSLPVSRPGFQGMSTPSIMNSGSMLSSGMVGMPSPVSMHSGPASGQGNAMLRPREALHMMRPGQNAEHQRQLMVPELQLQVTQGNSQGIPAFNGLSSFSNQTTPPPVQTYPLHPQQQHQLSPQQSHVLSNAHHPHLQGPNHTTGPQHQAYAIRIAKQQQQRYMHQQQFAASSPLMSHVQPQSQLPISSSMQNSSQIQSQTASQPVSLPSLTPPSPMNPISLQHQQKHHLPSHGLSRNAPTGVGVLTNQMGKQRQRQPQQQFQQSGRHHPQQRQHAQSQQQAKVLKGMGRGNMVLHQNLSVDPSHLNGLSVPPGSQAAEKGEQIMHLMQGQGLYSGSGLNPVQSSKPLVSPQSSNHSQPQQKLFSGPTPTSKPLQQMPSHSDNSTQGQVPPVCSGHTLSAMHQAVVPAIMPSNHQHLPIHPKHVNQIQSTAQRMLQQNRQLTSDKSQNDQVQSEQRPVNSASQTSTSTTAAIPQACNDRVVPVSSAIASQWKASEPVYDSGMPNTATQVGSIGSPPTANSVGSDSVPSVGQGSAQRQLSGSLPLTGHNIGAQWQQQQSQLQPSPTPLPPSPQPYQPQEQQLPQNQQQSPQQLPLQQQSQQQFQHLQAAQGSLSIRPTNLKMD